MAGICLLKIYVKAALELPASYQYKISLSVEMNFVINIWQLTISDSCWSAANPFETTAMTPLTPALAEMQASVRVRQEDTSWSEGMKSFMFSNGNL